jgi:hypothetical protein
MVFFGAMELDWEIIAAQEILIQAKTDVGCVLPCLSAGFAEFAAK